MSLVSSKRSLCSVRFDELMIVEFVTWIKYLTKKFFAFFLILWAILPSNISLANQ